MYTIKIVVSAFLLFTLPLPVHTAAVKPFSILQLLANPIANKLEILQRRSEIQRYLNMLPACSAKRSQLQEAFDQVQLEVIPVGGVLVIDSTDESSDQEEYSTPPLLPIVPVRTTRAPEEVLGPEEKEEQDFDELIERLDRYDDLIERAQEDPEAQEQYKQKRSTLFCTLERLTADADIAVEHPKPLARPAAQSRPLQQKIQPGRRSRTENPRNSLDYDANKFLLPPLEPPSRRNQERSIFNAGKKEHFVVFGGLR